MIKQTVGDQRTSNIKELAVHLKITRRYHRLHWSFNQDLMRRIHRVRCSLNEGLIRQLYLKLVLTMTIILLLLLLRKSKTTLSFCLKKILSNKTGCQIFG
jgi:hypothetical protein